MGRVSLGIVFVLSLLASVSLAAYECGRQVGGKIFGDYACCSQWGYCGFTYQYCSPKINCQSNCVPLGEVVTNVTSYYAYLNQHDYNIKGNVQCAQWYSDKPLEWHSRYEWMPFVDQLDLKRACGRCLKVTNLAIGAHTTVRIADTCATGGLNLGEKPFKQIDTDGSGYFTGHLTVIYEFVACGDKPKLISTI